MTTPDTGSGFEDPTTLPNNDEESTDDDNVGLIVGLAVGITLFIVCAIFFYIWCYRRKHGRWPKPIRRRRTQRENFNPYGSKSYAARWQKPKAPTGREGMTSHRADFKDPISNEQALGTISQQISEHLRRASKTMSLEEEKMRRTHPKLPETNFKKSASCYDVTEVSTQSSRRSRFSDDIGLYQDRTLPATLMMTSESKNNLFSKENSSLKRSNSATLRAPLNFSTPSSKSALRRSEDAQKYNDFGSQPGIGRYGGKRANRKTSVLSSSSKPSNTSDYVSDIDGSIDTSRRSNRPRSVIVDDASSSSTKERPKDKILGLADNPDKLLAYRKEIGRALKQNKGSLTVTKHEANSNSLKLQLNGLGSRFLFDDRTESQQNTMRSEAFYDYVLSETDDSIFEGGQSSDTESMAGSCATMTESGSFRVKRRQYDSDGAAKSKNSSIRSKTRHKTKRKCRRARSDGWESEPGQDSRQNKQNSKNSRQRGGIRTKVQERYSRTMETAMNEGEKVSNKNKARKRHGTYCRAEYSSVSLKSPVVGTVVEMPIYSQATWAGPGSKPRRKRQASQEKHYHLRKPPLNTDDKSDTESRRRSPRKKRQNARKLSIGGGGRFFCEYGSLPVDLSKLPKGLVAKIGGQTDQLLEPIDQLNFDKLCRPLPSLGKTEGELSARRLVSENLPPDHKDREILKNTYEYEDTGLVMTDL
ncbi:uncharacterized protein LOC143470574 [Clavelina lepadiformis]|uniref:uncharacterized protein LOC143470574 n=1 Tax=Clavelina lepadiformis TaxID=159417 RepID=UPI0040437658